LRSYLIGPKNNSDLKMGTVVSFFGVILRSYLIGPKNNSDLKMGTFVSGHTASCSKIRALQVTTSPLCLCRLRPSLLVPPYPTPSVPRCHASPEY
jgi:hypothetical protein